MKKQILKIAGVKSEKEFYKKFPTEEAFMKAHGKELKKAQIGSYIGGTQDPGFQPINFKDVYEQADYTVTGMTDEMRKEEALRQAQMAAAQKEAGGGGGGLAGSLQGLGEVFQDSDIAFSAKKGKKIKKAQIGAFTPSGTPMNLPSNPAIDYSWTNFNQRSIPQPSLSGPDVTERMGGFEKNAGAYVGGAQDIIQGIQMLKAQREMLRGAQQMQQVSDVALQAARIRPEETQRRYVRPEDIERTGEETFPIYGTGTNPLARNGKMVGGIPGEIANTFAPNTLYDDLGYEPLNDSERYKQFYYGGEMRKAQDGDWLSGTGIYKFAQKGGGPAGRNVLTSAFGESAGGNIGGGIGKIAGTAIGGPVGGMIGEVGGQLIGSLIDRTPGEIKRARQATQKNVQSMAMQQAIPGVQAQYSSFMKDGGTTSPYAWVSHTWQPQKIVSFGGHNLKDLLKPPHDADMLRAGGHLKEYTPPSERAMSTERPDFQLGGELQTHWGGYAEPMSYNPYMPGTGETVMFRGKLHDDGGIGITYGENPVEVERGEPMFEMEEGGQIDPQTGEPKKSGVVLGNIKITGGLADMLGDPKAKGKKFKTYGAELSKKENKINKQIEKAMDKIDNNDDSSPFGRIADATWNTYIVGGNGYLKDYAEKKMNAAALQTAVHDTKEEDLLKITDKGDIVAKKGINIPKAQAGTDLPKLEKKDYDYLKDLYSAAEKQKKGPAVLKFQREFHRLAGPYAKQVLSKEPVTSYGKSLGITAEDLRSNEDQFFGKRTKQYMSTLDEAMETPVTTAKRDLPEVVVTAPKKPVKEGQVEEIVDPVPFQKVSFMDYFNQALPFLRPTDAEALDAQQLAGEMYALATNQLEPVRAQLFQPELTVPFDISLQDVLNENEATFRAQQRLLGYNPAGQSMLNAQKYMANQKVLGEQFRMNQGLKNQIYKENRDLLNQANLQNLGILDQQYVRQEEAKSKTKATTQAALNSIAAKYAQNRLENRTLQTYENLYNYRFDPRFRAVNMNPLVDFERMVANASPAQLAEYQKVLEQKGKKAKSETARNGSIVKNLKRI